MMGGGRGGGGGGGEQQQQPAAPPRLGRMPKEGERILAPTRRPDGTLRKPIRIRAGYVPQDEVAIYQSKGALLRKAAQPEVPPGCDPVLDGKPKTKSTKRNDRKKEKKHQAALASATGKGENIGSNEAREVDTKEIPPAEHSSEYVDSVTGRMNLLSVSAAPSASSPSPDSLENSNPGEPGPDLDKKIRALKKKIRLVEAQQKGERQNLKPEQLQKMAKLEGWREELKLLEGKKVALVS